MAKKEKYIQVGVTALRDPVTGDFLPAIPLYIEAKDGAEEGQQKLIDGIGKLLAIRMQKYKEGCLEAGIKA